MTVKKPIVSFTIFIAFVFLSGTSFAQSPGCSPACSDKTDCDNDGQNAKECGGPIGLDCNDNDKNIYYGAPEGCDGKDSDCFNNGPAQDEVDNDGDGMMACNPLECNDTDPNVYYGAPEGCDGKDSDCFKDGPAPDEVDNDHDTFMQCDGDCNDIDSSINPNAIEICNDNIDNDCDNSLDCGDIDRQIPPDSDCIQVCTGIPEYPSVLVPMLLTLLSIAALKHTGIL